MCSAGPGPRDSRSAAFLMAAARLPVWWGTENGKEVRAVRRNANGLTDNQQAFCDEYLIDRNATRAYKAAYPRVKNDETAKACGSRLLTKANVSAYIAAQEAAIHDASIASATEVRQFLTSVMRGEVTESVPVFVMRGVQELADAPAGLTPRIRAAELLGKVMGLFTDQVSVSVAEMPKITVCQDGSAFVENEE